MYVFAYICICLHIWIYIMDDMSNKMANWWENMQDIYSTTDLPEMERRGDISAPVGAKWSKIMRRTSDLGTPTLEQAWLCVEPLHTPIYLLFAPKRKESRRMGGCWLFRCWSCCLLQSSSRLALHAFGNPLTILCSEEPCQNKPCVFSDYSSSIPIRQYIQWYPASTF